MQTRGKVSGADLETVRAAGFTDAIIVGISALSARFMLTNFVNNAFDTEIDLFAVDAFQETRHAPHHRRKTRCLS
jgi:hypothetical protein